MQEQDGGAQAPEGEGFVEQEENKQECNGESCAENGNPFRPAKEAVCGVIADAEDEIAGEAAEREKDNPLYPFPGLRLHHAIHQQQAPKSDIRERRSERSRISEATQGPFVEETAFEMVENARRANEYRTPSNYKAKKSRDGRQSIGRACR